MKHKPTGWVTPQDRYAVPALFNPYTGEPRDVRDVQSDPQGQLITPPGRVYMLAATVEAPQSAQQIPADVAKDAARYRWLRNWKGQEHEPPFTVQHELDGILWGGDLDTAIDAAMQGEQQ